MRAAWHAWFEELGGAVIDAGSPFGPSKTVGMDGSEAEGCRLGLTGYTILEAESLRAAVEMVRSCPALENADIAVYEAVPFA